MRIVAILTCYNESRFIGHVLRHYRDHGVEVYILDNESTDESVAIASEYLDDNLIAIETVPREGKDWFGMLRRKEAVADRLGADWYLHADPDEIRLPPEESQTLGSAIAAVDDAGYNAINFMEYTFVPTEEQPDHDHDDFLATMTSYYPFLPKPRNRLNAWKHPRSWPSAMAYARAARHQRTLRPRRVKLRGGGHQVSFPGRRVYPVDFKMRHYIVLSLEHAIEKYVGVDYPEADRAGDWRGRVSTDMFRVPRESELKHYVSDDELDPTAPRTSHIFLDTGAA